MRREIAILKKCSHPNIVELKEVLDDVKSNKIYLVLEYLECGEILWQSGEGVPLMTLDQAREVARDVISGLEYLHFQGIIHRDIKPANLLRDKAGNVKISDFGVSYASSLGQFNNDELELAKTAGTPAFFAPELCASTTDASRPPITSKIDVWAFGVTMYCLLFGKVPFIAESEFELFKVIVNQPLTFPDEDPPPKPKRETSLPPCMFYSFHNPSNTTQSSCESEPVSEPEPKAISPPDPDLETAKDLLRCVLEKDPTRRFDIMAIKQHPWMLKGMDDSGQEDFLTSAQKDQKIEVSNEEVQTAVIGIAGKIKRSLTKLGSHALHITGIRRKGSTSSSSSFTQTSSTSTSRSNSIDRSSRRNSRDHIPTSKRMNSIVHDSDHNIAARPISSTNAFNDSLYWKLDRELSNKSNNSSSTSLSSSLSSGTSFPNSPRGVVWKKAYSGIPDIPVYRSGAASRNLRGMPERRASVATVGSGSTQDSFADAELAAGMAYVTFKPPHRTMPTSASHLNINSLLEEPLINTEVIPPPRALSPRTSPTTFCSNSSGLETPKANRGRFFEHPVPPDLDLTPNKSSFGPSPSSPRSPGSRFEGSMYSDRSLTLEPTPMFASPVRDSSRSPVYQNHSSSSESGSDSDGGELVLTVGARPNAPSTIARRLAARNSEGNLRGPGARLPQKLGPGIGRVNSSKLSPTPGSPIDSRHFLPNAGPLALEPSIIIDKPKSSLATVSTATVHAVANTSDHAARPLRPEVVERAIGRAPTGPRIRSLSVAVGEIQRLRQRDNFGLPEEDA